MKVNANLPCLSALLAVALLISGCASQQYMGVSLKPGGADPAVQALAVKAQGGDKQAQYELGRWFEDSTDADGLKKAIKLYQIAATPRGGSRMMYTPGPSGVTTSVVSMGPKIEGNEAAQTRLPQLKVYENAQKEQKFEEIHEFSNVSFKVKSSDLFLNEKSNDTACIEFNYELKQFYDLSDFKCEAYRYDFLYKSKK